MLDPEKAYNGFAVDDVQKAKEFYEGTLGLNASFVDRGQQLLQLELGGGTPTLVYTKPDYTPATYTVLNFPVSDVEGTVDELTAKGVTFERYDELDQDEKGIFEGGEERGPTIAWFTDPAGNILAVHEIV
jgi:catechol 2,3-dioxygenase-like lactoylglutathione lyase family enzyme